MASNRKASRRAAASAVGAAAVAQGAADCRSQDEVEALVEKKIWSPSYD